MIDDALFITGTQRSGTTLLEKLLTSQEQISILSQPFPLLFVEVKRAFLRSLGVGDERYPLGHLFAESRDDSTSLDRFLREWRTSRNELEALFAQMDHYSGQYTRFAPDRLDGALSEISADDDFAAVVRKLDRFLALDRGARWVGNKETFCEQLVPFLHRRGFRCAIIIRDPRDVVASLNHGRGHKFGGEIKPTLFNIRSWRKSVAMALTLEGQPRFHWCRYDDLATDPAGAMSRLAEALQIGEIDPVRLTELRDTAGVPWSGNSSFTQHRGVSTASIGVHRTVLPPDVAEEIEATCLPELRLLGYETTMTTADALRVMQRFREPYGISRRGMERDAATPENAALEAERLQRLIRGAGNDSRRWFLFDRAEARLREALPA